MAFYEFFKIHMKLMYRNPAGVFWTIVIPIGIYVALSMLPLKNLVDLNIDYPLYLLPGIVALVVMQSGIYTLAYAMIEFKGRGVLKRLAVTPLTKTQFILSLLAARLTLMLIQVFVLTAIGVAIFNAAFDWKILTIMTFVILGGSIFLLIGLIISTIAKTYESAAPITAGLGLPLAFLGNIFYPIQNLPLELQSIAKALPITYLANGLRGSYTNGLGLGDQMWEVIILLIWFGATLLVATWRFRLED